MQAIRSRRLKWLVAALIVLLGALVSGNLTANEAGFSNDSGSMFRGVTLSLEPMLWILGSALMGMIGWRRFGDLK